MSKKVFFIVFSKIMISTNQLKMKEKESYKEELKKISNIADILINIINSK